MLNFEKAKIYGVDKVGSSNPAALIRTDDAVGLNVTVGTTDITSDFDRCYPYCDMQEVTDAAGNVFIKIPKFYAKITPNADGTFKHQISGVRYDGFSTLFVDGEGNELDYILVGKYEASGNSSRAYSKTGATVLVNITCDALRTACKANGDGYQQYDFLIDLIIKELCTGTQTAIRRRLQRAERTRSKRRRGRRLVIPTASTLANIAVSRICGAILILGVTVYRFRPKKFIFVPTRNLTRREKPRRRMYITETAPRQAVG